MVTSLPAPPLPFDAAEIVLPKGVVLSRVHSNQRDPRTPNPGFGPPTRFAFFPINPAANLTTSETHGTSVPVIYAAETSRAAIAETILHDAVRVLGRMNAIGPASYLGLTLSELRVSKPMRLADLTGLNAKRLGLESTVLSAHSVYGETVLWAEAAYRAGFDGLSYMSHRCNTDRAFVFFERPSKLQGRDRKAELSESLELASAHPIDPVLIPSTGFDAIVDACTAAGFEVLV